MPSIAPIPPQAPQQPVILRLVLRSAEGSAEGTLPCSFPNLPAANTTPVTALTTPHDVPKVSSSSRTRAGGAVVMGDWGVSARMRG